MSEQTDHARRQLMERAQKGDREAFRALVRDIGPALTSFLRRRIADPHELEDTCQETLLAIYQSRHTYEPARPLEPWLFAIARHVAANHFRRNWSRASWQELADEMPENGIGGSGNLLVKLRQALHQLPQVQREALMMMKIEGLSLAEASERTGASVGTLKVRVHRAYEFLRKSLLG
jgi:RNA polymerase sigma-70 factor (ECF subfamily)